LGLVAHVSRASTLRVTRGLSNPREHSPMALHRAVGGASADPPAAARGCGRTGAPREAGGAWRTWGIERVDTDGGCRVRGDRAFRHSRSLARRGGCAVVAGAGVGMEGVADSPSVVRRNRWGVLPAGCGRMASVAALGFPECGRTSGAVGQGSRGPGVPAFLPLARKPV